jgi:hypothetical protein
MRNQMRERDATVLVGCFGELPQKHRGVGVHDELAQRHLGLPSGYLGGHALQKRDNALQAPGVNAVLGLLKAEDAPERRIVLEGCQR